MSESGWKGLKMTASGLNMTGSGWELVGIGRSGWK